MQHLQISLRWMVFAACLAGVAVARANELTDGSPDPIVLTLPPALGVTESRSDYTATFDVPPEPLSAHLSAPSDESARLTDWPPERPVFDSLKTGPSGADDDWVAAASAECPSNFGVMAFFGYDTWRGVSDDSWQNNGLHTGLNIGTRLGSFSDATGIGFQAGASVGVYDWMGTDYRLNDQNVAETQGFLTYGFFRKAGETSRFSAAVVQDWMFNANFGIFSENPALSQVRAQAGYAINELNEVGLWGTCRVFGDSRLIEGVGPTSWRAVNQLNLYWHHKWERSGADTRIWVGMPEQSRLNGTGSLGDYIAGVSATVPLSQSVGVYSQVSYMHPSAQAGSRGSEEEVWAFMIGLSFYPAGNARTRTVAGGRWMPEMSVANNGLFFVDTSRH